MRLLLDTHAFLWFTLNDKQLSGMAKTLLEDASNEVLVSPATYWEIAIKVSLKKLELFAEYDEFMKQGIVGNDFHVLPIEVAHTNRLLLLPHHHRDPFDRLLIAQAIEEQIPIISADQLFDQYGVVRLW
ncbi:MAG: type II toxin-antitoxin system VapC family toxin [Gemmatales bacterium]